MRELDPHWLASDREGFRQRLVRSAFAGVLAGVLALLAVWLGFRFWLPYLAVAFALIANARGHRFDQVLLCVLGVLLPALPFVAGLSPVWRTLVQGALCGPLLVLSRRGELLAGTSPAERGGPAWLDLTGTSALTGALFTLAIQ